jgi:3-hydroxyisobutyrate dehydrogenase-like beta-hydroxyacid dehydrogenase
MGHSVGARLQGNGMRVIACLAGRSARTHELAAEAEIEAVATYADLVEEADLLLSILVPAQAAAAAAVVAAALQETGAALAYADCNAIAPQTATAIGAQIEAAGGTFVDASIIGGPPRGQSCPRLYVSGPDTRAMEALTDYGLDVIRLGDEVGLASAIKMCYAAWTKGSTALFAELLVAAQAMGVFEALEREFQSSQSAMVVRMQRLPAMPIKSRRFVGEMLQIAKAFGDVGMTPKMLQGAAEVYQFVGETALAERTPEDTSPMPTLGETMAALVAHLMEGE